MGKKERERKLLVSFCQCMTSSDLNITIHYDLVIVLFLRKSYGVHSEMYSVGCECSARKIQPGTGRATTGRRYFLA